MVVLVLDGVGVAGVPAPARPRALVGRLAPRSAATDSTTGHWELMGLVTDVAPPTYPDGFPASVMDAFAAAVAPLGPRSPGRGWLGNVPASGTEIIDRLGAEHLATGWPIVYTSADSVFQVAAHESVWDAPRLYAACAAARRLFAPPHAVARVIARPFAGPPAAFRRTTGRRDLALPPPADTALDRLAQAGVPVEGVGKVGQLFAGRGLSGDHPTADNAEGMRVAQELARSLQRGLVLANLLDQDTHFGHRNDPAGFAACLQRLDADLGRLLAALGPGDLLVITADHGNDPTHPGTDHTREWVPLLAHAPPRGSAWRPVGGGAGRRGPDRARLAGPGG